MWASHCWLLVAEQGLERSRASVAVAHGVRSCGTRGQELGTVAYLPQGMWDLPGSGMELAPPTLAAEFLPTEPPGKPLGILEILVFYTGIW